jgi:FkbM family methyltransferase
VAALLRPIAWRRLHEGATTLSAPRFWHFSRGFGQDRELWLDEIVSSILQNVDGLFVDVGVNKGQTLLKVHSLDSGRPYIGFEPHLECCFYAERIIRQNQLKRHLVFPVALAESPGVLPLFVPGRATDCSSTIAGFCPDSYYSEQRYIIACSGDQMVEALKIDSIAMIKIDVEGGELEVMRGFRQTLDQLSPILIFEVLPYCLVPLKQKLSQEQIDFRSGRAAQMSAFLKEKNYRILRILPGQPLVEIDEFDPGEVPDLSGTNYLAVPSGKDCGFLQVHAGHQQSTTAQ